MSPSSFAEPHHQARLMWACKTLDQTACRCRDSICIQMQMCVLTFQVALERAAKLVGRLAYNRAVKEAVRDAQVTAYALICAKQSCFRS